MPSSCSSGFGHHFVVARSYSGGKFYDTVLDDYKGEVLEDQIALGKIVKEDNPEEFARITQRIVDSKKNIALWQGYKGNSVRISSIWCRVPLLILVCHITRQQHCLNSKR